MTGHSTLTIRSVYAISKGITIYRLTPSLQHPGANVPTEGHQAKQLPLSRWPPDVANHLLTGRIRVDDHLINVRKDLCIPMRCIKCQEYGHTQDTCIGVDRCSNCSSEFHHWDKCDRAPAYVLCGAGSNHPSTSPTCPTFLRKCDALDGCFPENTMPYFPSKEGWN